VSRYLDKLESGRCVANGCALPPTPGRVRCDGHLRDVRDHVRAYDARRAAEGLCRRAGCLELQAPHARTCTGCLAKQKAYDDRRRGVVGERLCERGED
jgi:hypothetical protein